MKKLFVYGTLRKGGRLHYYINDDPNITYEPLGQQEIAGFDMFSLDDSYPYVVRGKAKLFGEIYELPDNIVSQIERMERGAGYELTEVDTDYGKAQLFYMGDDDAKAYAERGYPQVESGNWLEYLNHNNS